MTRANRKLLTWVFALMGSGWLCSSLCSCGKATVGNPQLVNIQYQVLNLSPDLRPCDLFINFAQVNTNPYIFGSAQGYFYVPSIDTPYQIRSALNTGTTELHRDDKLTSGAKYTLYITGAVGDGSLTSFLTVDTALSPPAGTGGLRFVNVSPTALGGLDLYANGTKVYKTSVVYQQTSSYASLPAGNYDLQIEAAGTTSILNEQPSVTIQNGRLYTIFAYGYTTVADSASFTSQITTNY